MNDTGYVVISRDVLPEIFAKVFEAKKLIACGEEKSSAAACKRVGISRSAYYKYRDSVFSYEEKMTGSTITLFILLKDKPGVLSNVLSEIHSRGANVLTLNQSVPVDGAASVTATLRLDSHYDGFSFFCAALTAVEGVIEAKLISGE